MAFKEVGRACLFKSTVLLRYLVVSKHLLKLQSTVKNTVKHCKIISILLCKMKLTTEKLKVCIPELVTDFAVVSLELRSRKSLKSLSRLLCLLLIREKRLHFIRI